MWHRFDTLLFCDRSALRLFCCAFGAQVPRAAGCCPSAAAASPHLECVRPALSMHTSRPLLHPSARTSKARGVGCGAAVCARAWHTRELPCVEVASSVHGLSLGGCACNILCLCTRSCSCPPTPQVHILGRSSLALASHAHSARRSLIGAVNDCASLLRVSPSRCAGRLCNTWALYHNHRIRGERSQL